MWLPQGKRLGLSTGRDSVFPVLSEFLLAIYYLRGINTNEENEGRMRERNFFEQPFEKWGGAFQQVETCDQNIPEWRKSHKERHESINMKGTVLPIPIYAVQI